MKKNLFLIIALALLLSGCATTVRLETLAPSQVDLGANQVIAVAPVTYEYLGKNYKYIPVRTGEGIPVPDEIKTIASSDNYYYAYEFAVYAENAVYRALSDGVYRIVDAKTTDKYLDSVTRFNSVASVLTSNGITLLFDSSIDGMYYDEYIDGKAVTDDKGNTYYVYYLVQKASLSYSYHLLDLKEDKVVDAKAYFGRYPVLEYEYRTRIAQRDANGKVSLYTQFKPTSVTIYKEIFDGFTEEIRDRLIPHKVTLSFNLISERRNKEFEEINKLVNEGYLGIAYDQYMAMYGKTGNIAAAYNASILNYALGNQVEAIVFVRELYEKTLNSDMGKLLQKMVETYNMEQKALNQITE